MCDVNTGDLCVVKAEPGNRPHRGTRNDKHLETEREEEDDREQVLSCIIRLSPDFSHFIPSYCFCFFFLS